MTMPLPVFMVVVMPVIMTGLIILGRACKPGTNCRKHKRQCPDPLERDEAGPDYDRPMPPVSVIPFNDSAL